MQTGLQHLHNLFRWIIVILAVITLIKSLSGLGGKKEFTNGDRKTALFLMISADIQLLLGLALYFMKGWSQQLSSPGFMKNAVLRYWAMEHAVGMILAIVLIHVGYSAAKSNRPAVAKFRRLFVCVLLAVIVAVAVMPWPSRPEGIARPLFPGMH
jgi:hypothetical protein